MSATMRAKMNVVEVKRMPSCDVVKMTAVCRSSSYPNDGLDEDNTYAKFTPSGVVELTISNPALLGKIEPGKKFYLDFTPAE